MDDETPSVEEQQSPTTTTPIQPTDKTVAAVKQTSDKNLEAGTQWREQELESLRKELQTATASHSKSVADLSVKVEAMETELTAFRNEQKQRRLFRKKLRPMKSKQ